MKTFNAITLIIALTSLLAGVFIYEQLSTVPGVTIVSEKGKAEPLKHFIEVQQSDSIASYSNNTCYVSTEIWVTYKQGRALEILEHDRIPCAQVAAMKEAHLRKIAPKLEQLNQLKGEN